MMKKTDYVRTRMEIDEFTQNDILTASEGIAPHTPDPYEGGGY